MRPPSNTHGAANLSGVAHESDRAPQLTERLDFLEELFVALFFHAIDSTSGSARYRLFHPGKVVMRRLLNL